MSIQMRSIQEPKRTIPAYNIYDEKFKARRSHFSTSEKGATQKRY